MALIDCPECGARVSDVAPACPQCGFPVANQVNADASPQGAASSGTSADTPATQPTIPPLPTERSAEPFRIGGRRVPIAAILFWGGLVVGVALNAAGGGEETPFRYVPYTMIFLGMGWFAVTEFIMLVRGRHRRRRGLS